MTSRATPEGPVRTTDGALGPHAQISLHDHLDGALRPATVVELAAQVGHELPATDPDSLGQWFRDSADSGSLPRYLETFSHTVAVMQTASALRRVAREYVEDCAADGLVHAEVRWAPEQHVSGGLTLGEAVDAERPLAVVAGTITFVLLVVYLVLGVRSFIVVRRERRRQVTA